MRLEPVRDYRHPTYPTRDELERSPELLHAIPARWRGHPVVVTVLAALSSAGCQDRGEGGAPATSAPGASAEAPRKQPPRVDERAALSKVAPVFEHGTGMASSGGVSATAMVFLTEDEAMRVVLDEAAKAGLTFTRNGSLLSPLGLPRTTLSGKPHEFTFGSLILDGYDSSRKIGFEFVSREDFAAWGEEPTESTAATYDMIGTARALRESMDRSPEAGTFGVFYDPIAPYDAPPSLPEGTFDQSTRAPLQLFRPEEEGYRVEWGGKRLRFDINSAMAEVDGAMVKMPVSAVLRGKALYVPLKFVTEALGGKVSSNEPRREVSVQIPAAGINRVSRVNVLDFGGEVGRGTFAFGYADREAFDGPTLRRSEELLRAQVRDFIAWLKGQGVI